jgi:multicomponent Na+:H+ antiporter subunit D
MTDPATAFAAGGAGVGSGGGTDILFTALVLGPLAVGTLIGLLPRHWSPRIAAAGLILCAAAALMLAVAVHFGGTLLPATGGWQVPLGIKIVGDGPAAAMVLMAACVMVGAGAYLLIDQAPHGRSPVVWATLFLLWTGLNTLFLTADLFNAYVALEIASLGGVALIVLSGTGKALTAQMRYLLLATGASLIYLMGVAVVYAITGRLDGPGQNAEALPPAALTAVLAGLALMTLGLLIKMAAWPVHGWLPPAHAGAIPPVSAILSALVVKAAAILLVRLWTGPFMPVVPDAAPILIGILGSGAIFWGSVKALQQLHLKQIIAYSTIAQLGYLLVAVPIIVAGQDTAIAVEAWSGALIHALSHGLAKAGLFLAAGAIVVAAGSDHLRVLLGASRTMPIATMAIAVAAVSIMGLPPSIGFLGNWLLLRAAIAGGAWWWAIPIIGGGFLAAAYMFRILAFAFRPVPSGYDVIAARRRPALEAIALVLALLTVVAGVGGGLLAPLTAVEPGWSGIGESVSGPRHDD